MIKYSIIIPTFNRADLTKACVYSLKYAIEHNQNKRVRDDYEIIVVDDGSTDDTYSYFSSMALKAPRFKLVSSDKQLGEYRNPGWARNVGLKVAEGTYVCFCDGDMLHARDPLIVMDEILGQNEKGNIYITGIYYRSGNNCIQGPFGRGVAMPHGGWLGVKREHILKIGGYDQRFRRYGSEDTDIVRRFKSLGLTHISTDEIISIHPTFESGRNEDNEIDKISKDIQLEIQRDPSVVRNEDIDWGTASSIVAMNIKEPSLGKDSDIISEGFDYISDVDRQQSYLRSIADSLALLTHRERKNERLFQMVHSMHRGIVSMETPLFVPKKHLPGDREIFKLIPLSGSVASDSLQLIQAGKAIPLHEASHNSLDIVVLSQMTRNRNVGLYLDASFELLKTGGICIILCPSFSNSVGSGNTYGLWNAGYLLYNLVMAGYDCKYAKVATFENEIQIATIKSERRCLDISLTMAADFFPIETYQHFNGNIKEVNWNSDPIAKNRIF